MDNSSLVEAVIGNAFKEGKKVLVDDGDGDKQEARDTAHAIEMIEAVDEANVYIDNCWMFIVNDVTFTPEERIADYEANSWIEQQIQAEEASATR